MFFSSVRLRSAESSKFLGKCWSFDRFTEPRGALDVRKSVAFRQASFWKNCILIKSKWKQRVHECEIEVGLTKVANRKKPGQFQSAHFDFTFLSRERSVGALVSCIGKLRSSSYDFKKIRSKNIFSSWRKFTLKNHIFSENFQNFQKKYFFQNKISPWWKNIFWSDFFKIIRTWS